MADEAAKPAAEESILDAAGKPVVPEKPAGDTPAKPDAAKPADGSAKPAADGAKPEEKPAEIKPDATKPVGAPEKYEEFKVPEGVTLIPTMIDGFKVVAKELGLSQDQAQKLVDFQTGAVKAATDEQAKTFQDLQKGWAAETRKALGADADKQLAFAAAARDKFAPEKSVLREILNDSGLANHPAVIQHFITIGKAISEDGFVAGAPAPEKVDKTAGDVVYPDQGKEGK